VEEMNHLDNSSFLNSGNYGNISGINNINDLTGILVGFQMLIMQIKEFRHWVISMEIVIKQ
jgi:hypothetical protein